MFCGWLLLMIYQSTDVCLFGDSAQVQKVFKGYSELSNHKQQTKSKGAVHQTNLCEACVPFYFICEL